MSLCSSCVNTWIIILKCRQSCCYFCNIRHNINFIIACCWVCSLSRSFYCISIINNIRTTNAWRTLVFCYKCNIYFFCGNSTNFFGIKMELELNGVFSVFVIIITYFFENPIAWFVAYK